MAEAVSSAVVQHTISQIVSGLVQKYEGKYESGVNTNLERLEMAHIRLEAALETSYKWQITDASLLRWRKKLKSAAQECDDTLHKCKRRILEDEQTEQEVRNSSLPKRIAHATKSFVISAFSSNNKLGSSIVQRFEWFADGASEFLRFVEVGGTPHRHIYFHSLVKNLFAGKELHYKIARGNEYPLFQLFLLPLSTTDYGLEANLIVIEKDDNRPEVTTYFSIVLQVSEATDIVGTAIKCLHLFSPPFQCAIENIRKELTQLHTRNISWVSSVYSCQKEYYDLHMLGSQWFRPNPLCCKQHNRSELQHISNSRKVGLPDVSLESVNEVTFQTFLSQDTISMQDAPALKMGISFAPHGSLKVILPSKSSGTMAVVCKDQYFLHTDIILEQLKEIMLPKAIDYFRQNADAAVYPMIWKSEHGYALVHFQKVSMSTRETSVRSRKRKLFQKQDHQGPWNWEHIISHLLDIWGAHMSTKLRSYFVDWLRKEREGEFAAQQRHPYFLKLTATPVSSNMDDKRKKHLR